MKVQVLVSKPKSLDITLNEMMEKWHMLELIPGLECHFYTYIDTTIPRASVMANPLIGPVPNM